MAKPFFKIVRMHTNYLATKEFLFSIVELEKKVVWMKTW